MTKRALPDLNEVLARRPPSETDFAYLAGIMDGEGYFAGGRNTNSFGFRVSMSDYEAPRWLQETFGGLLYERQTTHKPHLIWYISRQADLRFLIAGVRPYLRVKGPRADAMLALLDHLAAQPTYEKLTRDCSRRERDERRAIRAEWKKRREELRCAIAASNFGVRRA